MDEWEDEEACDAAVDAFADASVVAFGEVVVHAWVDDWEAESPEHFAVVAGDVGVVAGDGAVVSAGGEGGDGHPDVGAFAVLEFGLVVFLEVLVGWGELWAVVPEDLVWDVAEAACEELFGVFVACGVHAVHGEDEALEVGDLVDLAEDVWEGVALEFGVEDGDDECDGGVGAELGEEGFAFL